MYGDETKYINNCTVKNKTMLGFNVISKTDLLVVKPNLEGFNDMSKSERQSILKKYNSWGNTLSMDNRNYKIVDNFNQEVKDFDVVASAVNKLGSQINELGICWGTIIFTLSDFDKLDSKSTLVSIKKNTLWNTGRCTNIVNRVEVEAGLLPGIYQMKNIIKLDNVREDIMDFRIKILTLIEEGRVTNNVPRKLVNEVLEDAKWAGYM